MMTSLIYQGHSHAIFASGASEIIAETLNINFGGDLVNGSLIVNGNRVPVTDGVCTIVTSLLRDGRNNLSIELEDGNTYPCEGIFKSPDRITPVGINKRAVMAEMICDHNTTLAELASIREYMEFLKSRFTSNDIIDL